MVARDKHPRNSVTSVHGRSRVLRMFQEALRVRVPDNGSWIAQNARNKTSHSIHKDHGGYLTTGQYIVADRDLIIGQELPHSFIYPLIATAKEQDTRIRY